VIRYKRVDGDWIAVSAVPSRADTIKAAWAMLRHDWTRYSVDGKLEAHHDLGIVEPMLFEQISYGDTWVIECEGVIVERVDRK